MSNSSLRSVPPPPSGPEPEPLSPALQEALRMYNELKNRCDFDLGTVTNVLPEQNLDQNDVRTGKYHIPVTWEYRHVSADLLLAKYPDQLTPDQRQALEVGMPKVYWAFEQVGFPDLSLRESTGPMKSFTSFGTIYFEEFAIPGRNFGHEINLLNDSKETILEALQKALDNSIFDKTAKKRRAEMRGFVNRVEERRDAGREAEEAESALQIEKERENVRRRMRGLKVDDESPQ